MTNLTATTDVKPRLAFVGVGWIGLHRMKAILEEDCADAAVIADPSSDALRGAHELVPSAASCDDLDAVLREDVDAVVLATPSGLHAKQAIRALEAGKSVFCQKPLGRTADETRQVVDAARRHDRLLGVDLSYRHTRAMRAVRNAVRSGEIGRVFAAELVFHNAYGPDKSWALDLELSGGGCVIDLGIHLVDLLHWTLQKPEIRLVTSALFREGRRLTSVSKEIEEFAEANIDLADGAVARLACSWHSSCGRDAVIEASFYGTEGTASFRNVNGSFYDFTAELLRGARTEVLSEPPDKWGGRAAFDFIARLAESPHYDSEIEDVIDVARTIDRIYGR